MHKQLADIKQQSSFIKQQLNYKKQIYVEQQVAHSSPPQTLRGHANKTNTGELAYKINRKPIWDQSVILALHIP